MKSVQHYPLKLTLAPPLQWCGHCKALAPVWDELGAHFAGVEGVGIFKMDATENEVDDPAVNVKGFPTV